MRQLESELPRLAPLAVVINALRAIERWSAYRASVFRGGPTDALTCIDKSTVRKSFGFRRNVVTARDRSIGGHSGYILLSTALCRGLKPRRWVHPPLVAFCLTWFKATVTTRTWIMNDSDNQIRTMFPYRLISQRIVGDTEVNSPKTMYIDSLYWLCILILEIVAVILAADSFVTNSFYVQS